LRCWRAANAQAEFLLLTGFHFLHVACIWFVAGMVLPRERDCGTVCWLSCALLPPAWLHLVVGNVGLTADRVGDFSGESFEVMRGGFLDAVCVVVAVAFWLCQRGAFLLWVLGCFIGIFTLDAQRGQECPRHWKSCLVTLLSLDAYRGQECPRH
jgi:hypothetical protein